MKYETDGKGLRKTAYSDSVITDVYILNGLPVNQLITYKNKNEKLRTANTYDEKGKKIEEKIYKTKEI